MAYTECYEKTGEFAPIIRETIAYVRRELKSPEGGFYTAVDAETGGVEGVYYCWTPQQVREVLGAGEGERFCFLYDITKNGNFNMAKVPETGSSAGMNIPNLIRMPIAGDDMVFASIALPKLLKARGERDAPAVDTKIILTSNALMAAALAKAGRALDERVYTDEAEKTLSFILGSLTYGRSLAAVHGRTIHAALDGYAYLIWALLETYHSTLNTRWLDEARSLGGQMIEIFSGEGGMLYYTAEQTDLPLRGINAHDGATPSGQSVAAHCFLTLSRLTGDAYWDDALQSLLEGMGEMRSPEAHGWMMAALLRTENSGTDVTLTPGGGLDGLYAALRGFHPFMTVRLDDTTKSEKAEAYVCREHTCLAPVTAPESLAGLITQSQTVP
jgi:hypothetical protein